jgi:hypothetical protein
LDDNDENLPQCRASIERFLIETVGAILTSVDVTDARADAGAPGNRRLAECQGRAKRPGHYCLERPQTFACRCYWHLMEAGSTSNLRFLNNIRLPSSLHELGFGESPQNPFGSPAGMKSGEGISLCACSTFGVAAASLFS